MEDKELLFEIEDYNYLLNKFFGVISVSIAILFILIVYVDFDILRLAHEDHRGHFLVYTGIPYIFFESIYIIYYIKKRKYKKIKFYKDRIINSDNTELLLSDFIDGYIIRFNFIQKKIHRLGWGIFIIGLPIGLYIYSCALIVRYLMTFYSGNKTAWMDNLLLIRLDNLGVGIPLQILNPEEKKNVENYLSTYLKKDVNSFEIKKIKVPEFRSRNLINKKSELK